MQKLAVWLVTVAAFLAMSRTLVHDLDVRMSLLPLPDPHADLFPVPGSAIDPTPLPPPPPPPPTGLDNLKIPVQGVKAGSLIRTFTARRSGGRIHEALDILAPRNTPVLAANDGTIVDMSNSSLGGITIYQVDAAGEYAYYYAHLQRYARGIRAGMRVTKGQTIGFVGTTGNAPPETPHLHFAVFRLKSPWQLHDGQPVDPYDLLTESRYAQQCQFKVSTRFAC
jgi:murein DD-endopeptidase MepM/ murein hydrolase activator NlpD